MVFVVYLGLALRRVCKFVVVNHMIKSPWQAIPQDFLDAREVFFFASIAWLEASRVLIVYIGSMLRNSASADKKMHDFWLFVRLDKICPVDWTKKSTRFFFQTGQNCLTFLESIITELCYFSLVLLFKSKRQNRTAPIAFNFHRTANCSGACIEVSKTQASRRKWT